MQKDANFRYVVESVYFDTVWNTVKILSNINLEQFGKTDAIPYVLLSDRSFKNNAGLLIDIMVPNRYALDRLRKKEDFGDIDPNYWRNTSAVVFPPGLPYAQLLFLPAEANYSVSPMSPEEAAKPPGSHGYSATPTGWRGHLRLHPTRPST